MKEERVALVLSIIALLISLGALGMTMSPLYLDGSFTLSCSPTPSGGVDCVMEPKRMELELTKK